EWGATPVPGYGRPTTDLPDAVALGVDELPLRLARNSALGNDPAHKLGAELRRAGLRGVVVVHQAEALRLAVRPLPVIHEAPVVIALKTQVRGTNRGQVVVDEAAAEVLQTRRAAVIAGAVLRDPDRGGVALVHPAGALDQPLRVDLPTKVIDRLARQRAVFEARGRRARVIIQPQVVVVLTGGNIRRLAAQHASELPTQHRVAQLVLEEEGTGPGGQPVQRITLLRRHEGPHMVREAH